ncbi:C6 zinc finger domain-containing protein [Thelonectria olida]|uniref:C6 zinc finger domain-containing protein n=1 Tax=Thelonectria olida TaxID=1576542 RepID=A0A9P8W2W7_9HYPO|nr:C6 zinc finger domain-containing protein [Thelonectria olida]
MALQTRTTSNAARKQTAVPKPSQTKAKRVRTGCLTCRERHLKCDEAVPDCMNCRKRGRECKRGIRLNFLDTNVYRPACVPPLEGWAVQFLDESRDVASEYLGGLGRYAPYDLKPSAKRKLETSRSVETTPKTGRQAIENSPSSQKDTAPARHSDFSPTNPCVVGQGDAIIGDQCCHPRTLSELSIIAVPSSSRQSNCSDTPFGAGFLQGLPLDKDGSPRRHSDGSSPLSTRTPTTLVPFADPVKFPVSFLPHGNVGPSSTDHAALPERDRLNTPEEIRYMQVFVEDVGIWLDSFNSERQFSHLIPHYALRSTMVLNAFLACGAKHMSFASPAESDKALFYHNTATSQLLRSLQNPDRNMADCATTAVILNVYEFMSEKPAHRMRHIGGARALILECGWDAGSTGTGAACFWQNITMELLICLSTHWQTTWDPEDWGLDLDFFREGGEETEYAADEVFVHRILYIVAKVVNFRAEVLHAAVTPTSEEQSCLGEQLRKWQELQRLCHRWNVGCPRTMHSYGYMKSTSSTNESTFPCIWLIRRTAILGRLFYHTAQCILAKHHPVEQVRCADGMRSLRLHHAHQICGIVTHTKDAGIAPVAIRCLATAASVLREYREQSEVLDMLERIKSQSGWHTDGAELELKRAWGWERSRILVSAHSSHFSPHMAAAARPFASSIPPLLTMTRALTPPVLSMAPVNPLSFADFSLPNHPYQNWYEPPNRTSAELKNE